MLSTPFRVTQIKNNLDWGTEKIDKTDIETEKYCLHCSPRRD